MHRYIDILQDLVLNYNNRPHKSLGQWTPSIITNQNEDDARYVVYLPQNKMSQPVKKYKFYLNDKIRISHLKHLFFLDYQQKRTEELFIFAKRYKHQSVPIYRLKDYAGDKIESTFYDNKMQMVNKNNDAMWHEKTILKKRKRHDQNEVFVKWMR